MSCLKLQFTLGVNVLEMQADVLLGRLEQLGHVLLRCAESFTDAVGGLEKVRNTPLPPVYDVFIRLISWLFGYAIFLDFSSNQSAITGILLFLAFLVAERVGAYVEGPFDRDGSSFSLPLDLMSARISSDLLGPDHPLARLPLSQDPSLWT